MTTANRVVGLGCTRRLIRSLLGAGATSNTRQSPGPRQDRACSSQHQSTARTSFSAETRSGLGFRQAEAAGPTFFGGSLRAYPSLTDSADRRDQTQGEMWLNQAAAEMTAKSTVISAPARGMKTRGRHAETRSACSKKTERRGAYRGSSAQHRRGFSFSFGRRGGDAGSVLLTTNAAPHYDEADHRQRDRAAGQTRRNDSEARRHAADGAERAGDWSRSPVPHRLEERGQIKNRARRARTKSCPWSRANCPVIGGGDHRQRGLVPSRSFFISGSILGPQDGHRACSAMLWGAEKMPIGAEIETIEAVGCAAQRLAHRRRLAPRARRRLPGRDGHAMS